MAERIEIDSVPSGAAETFRIYADEEFDGDQGMALRELVVREKLRSELHSIHSRLSRRIESLEQRIMEIEDDNNDEPDDDNNNATVG
jgi:BMFP domain-containing protein YqiC